MKTYLLLLTALFIYSAASLPAENSKAKAKSDYVELRVSLSEKSNGLTAEVSTPWTKRKQVIPDGVNEFRLFDVETVPLDEGFSEALIVRDKKGKELKPAGVDIRFRPTPKGALMIHGGGRLTRDFIERFVELAGGKDAPVVIIPTAMGGKIDPKKYPSGWIGSVGFKNVSVLHTNDRKIADTDEFVEPLRKAKAVWLSGGRQWRTADAYLNTKVQQEILNLYERGGVVAGSSAGATIQGSYLVRGDTRGNQLMMSVGHEQGFGLLPNAAIDQHVIARKRLNDITPVIARFPHLLGIGIDEGTAIVVEKSQFEVIGASKVAIYDAGKWEKKSKDEEIKKKHRYFFLNPGQRYDWRKREMVEQEKK